MQRRSSPRWWCKPSAMTSPPAFRLLDLPMELHDLVLSFMDPEILIAYSLAAYPHLASRRQHLNDYPPVLTRSSLRRICVPATPFNVALMAPTHSNLPSTSQSSMAPMATSPSDDGSSSVEASTNLFSSLAKQPSEVVLLYMKYLSQRDIVALALGEYRTLTTMGIAPWPLQTDIIHGLRGAVLRGG